MLNLNLDTKITDISLISMGGIAGLFASFIQLYGGFLITFLGFAIVAYTKIKQHQQNLNHKEQEHLIKMQYEQQKNELEIKLLKRQLNDTNHHQ